MFNSNSAVKSDKPSEEKSSNEKSTDVPQQTSEQLTFSFLKNIATNIQTGIRQFSLRPKVQELDTQKYMNLTNLHIDELWKEIFIEVDKIYIDT